MGFFSGIRRRIKKIIPKEVRPFIPYAAAMIPGLQGFAAGIPGITSMAAQKALIAGGTKFLTDDEADIKDVARAGVLAAAPDYISSKMQLGADKLNLANELKGAGDISKTAQMLETGSEGIKGLSGLKTVAAQGGIDYGIKAAELNKDALERYNADLLKQGIADKAGRRAAIRAIYSNTGTWDMDEVDSMLDTYGYRSGGRVGYAEGDMVLTERSMVTPEQRNQIEGNKMAEQAYNKIFTRFIERFPGIATGEETMEEMIAMLQAEEIPRENLGIIGTSEAMDMITPESVDRTTRRIMRGDTEFGDVGSMNFSDPDIDVGDYGQAISKKNGGRIGLKDGGDFNYEKFQSMLDISKEGLDSLEEDEEVMPIRELRLARGGIADINMKEQIDTPSGDMMMDENIKMTSNPEVMDSLNELSLMLFRKSLDELSEDEYEDLKDFAGQTSLKPGLIDEYRNYKMGQEDAGQPVLSPTDYFRMDRDSARMGAADGGMMASMDMDVPIQDLADEFEITFGRPPNSLDELKDFYKQKYEFNGDVSMMERSQRTMAAQGGLMNLGGKEMDLRGGGFVPMGAKERADDVPARLSKNEFVMTADAVRGAGGGSVQKGADLMYDQMKTLEAKA